MRVGISERLRGGGRVGGEGVCKRKGRKGGGEVQGMAGKARWGVSGFPQCHLPTHCLVIPK